MSDSETVLEKARARDHWQEEKDRLTAELEKKILGGRSEISIREILAVPLPDMLTVAFRNQARSIVRRERPLVLQSSHHFVLDDNEVKSHLRLLRELLIDRLVLADDEVRQMISFGVRLQFDVITKPRATLEALLYHKSVERQRDDIATIIVGLGEQRPMIAAVLNLIGSYPAGPVTKEAFSALCRRAEKTAYGEKPVTALMADLQDFAAFRNAIDGKGASEIDNQTVLGILFERNLKELAEGLLPTLTQKDIWGLPEIEKVLEYQIVAGGLALSSDEPGQVFLPAEFDLSEFIEETGREVSRLGGKEVSEGKTAPPQIMEKEPLEMALGSMRGGVAPPAPLRQGNKPGSLPVALNSAAESDETILIRHDNIEHQPPGPYPPLHRLIDEKSRRSFIKKIFRKDAGAYRQFVERVEATPSWKSAKAILDDELARRAINQYSKEAVKLSDLVFSRYFARR